MVATTVRAVADVVLAELIERHLQDLAVRKPSPHTLAAYRRDLEGVGRRIAAADGCQVGQLTVAALHRTAMRRAFADWAADHAAASVRRAWSAWNGFFEFLLLEDLVDANPMRAVAQPKSSKGRAKVIAGDDVAGRLLQTAATPDPTARWPWPGRDVTLLATFLVTGLRLSEAVGLDLAAFSGPEGARRLNVVGKGGKARTVPVEPAYEELVAQYLEERAERFPRHRLDDSRSPLFVRADNGERPSRQQVEYWVDKIYRRAGVRNQVPRGALVHALRHTFATSALDHGTDVVELQELLGHSSLDTTRRYLDATAAGLREAIAAHPAQAALKRFAARRA
ncbi:MAG: tyrosine-type recombinase/integrase [Acidimicrobiia bacterium]|nr:tyrosine-type recombinase/integrase [Acidimicrobiia bacterium]